MKTKKQTIKKISLWAMVLSLLFGTIAGFYVYADNVKVNINNVRDQLQKAAELQVIANTTKKCLNSVVTMSDFSSNTFRSGVEVSSGDIFAGTTNISTGPWLENATQGKVDDGEIWCKNEDGSILKKFAQKINEPISNIICNKENPAIPGLMTRAHAKFTAGYGNAQAYFNECNTYLNDDSMSNWVQIFNEGEIYVKMEWTVDGYTVGPAYVEKLYNDYIASTGNPFMVPWSSVGSYSQASGYYNYLNDFKTACSNLNELADSELSGRAYFAVDTISDNGEIIRKNYGTKDGGTTGSTDTGTSFVSGGPETCDGLKNKINEYAPLVQQVVKEKYKTECASALSSIAQQNLDKLNGMSNLTSEQQAEKEKLQNAVSSGDFTEPYGNDGIACLNIEGVEVGIVDDPTSGTTVEGDENECSKATSLGWIICPILKGLSNAVINLYDNTIEPFLHFDSGVLNSENGVKIAWSTFRDFANVVLVIFILVVVISQVTGFGIDNYGIKKALPKIIVAALLINISFFVAQIAVDLSNILGVSLRSLFEGLASRIATDPSSLIATDGTNPGITATVASGAVGAAAIAGCVAGLYFGGWAAVLMVLPAILAALIGALVSIFFFFVLLGMRNAAVILLIALSPLAFACQILPNTKKLFDKWLTGFKGLLLVYPIAGMLMGGGTLASVILLNANPNGGFWYALVAMLVQVVPFFLLPSILKGSFAALGNIGAKVSGLGQRWGRKLGAGTAAAMNRSANYNHLRGKAMEANANRLSGKLNEISQKKFGKDYDKLTDDEKTKLQNSGLGMRRRMMNTIAENRRGALALSGKEAEARDLADNSIYAGMGTMAAVARHNKNEDTKKWNSGTYTEDDKSTYNDDGVLYRGVNYGKDKDGNYYHSTGRKVNKTLQKEIEDNVKTGVAQAHTASYTYDSKTGTYRHGNQTLTKSEVERRRQSGYGSYATRKFTRDTNGVWASADGKSSAVYSDDQIRAKLDAREGRFTSYADSKIIESEAARSRDLGSTAAYAGMTAEQVVNLNQSNLRSATTSGEIQIDHTNTRATSGALRVERNEAKSQDNAVLGRAVATANLESQGREVVASVSSAAQSSQAQLVNTIAQNTAAPQTIMNQTQVQQAVDSGQVRLENQFAGNVATNEVGTTVLTPEVAHTRAMANRIATERKAWSDQFAMAQSGDVAAELEAALTADRTATTEQDHAAAAAKFSAAFQKLATTGNLPSLHTILEKENATSGLSDIMWNQMNQDLIGSSDTIFKQFAKQSFIAQGKGASASPDLFKFVTGQNQNLVDASGNTISMKNMTDTMGENLHFLDGQDKDTIEALTKSMARQDNSGNFIYQGQPPVQAKHLVSFATATNKGDELARIDDAIKTFGELFKTTDASGNRVLEPAAQQDLISKFAGAINGSALSKMSSDVVESIAVAVGAGQYDPSTKKTTITDPNLLQQVFGSAVKDVQNSEQLYASTSNSVRTLLGMTGAPAPNPAPNPGPTPTPTPTPAPTSGRTWGTYTAPNGTKSRAYQDANGYHFDDGTIIFGGGSGFTPD